MILLVEDNPDDERLAMRAFRKAGLPHRMVVAHDGEEAIKQVSAPHPWRLILLDLKLPKVGGLEVLKHIRSAADQNTLTPVVVLTSSDEVNDIRESYRLGANSYLRKPVDYEQFNTMFARVLDYWTHVNCPPN